MVARISFEKVDRMRGWGKAWWEEGMD